MGSGISSRRVNTVSAAERYQSLFCVVANVSTILCSDLLRCCSAGTQPEQSDLYIARRQIFSPLFGISGYQSVLLTQEKPNLLKIQPEGGERLDLTLNASFRKRRRRRRRKKKLRFGTILRGRRSQPESECRPCSQTHHDEETLKKRGGDGWGY